MAGAAEETNVSNTAAPKRTWIKLIKHKQRRYTWGTRSRNVHWCISITAVSWTQVVTTRVRPGRLCLHPGVGSCRAGRLSLGLRYSTTTWQQAGLQTLVCHTTPSPKKMCVSTRTGKLGSRPEKYINNEPKEEQPNSTYSENNHRIRLVPRYTTWKRGKSHCYKTDTGEVTCFSN